MLLSLKVFGFYYGPTKSDEISLGNSSRRQDGRYWLEKLYCCFVCAVWLWPGFIACLVSVGHYVYSDLGNRVFVVLVYSSWHFHVNFNALDCLASLPCGRNKKSRFETFLLQPLNLPEGQRFQRASSRKALVLGWSLVIVNTTLNTALNTVSDISLPQLPPWNRWKTISVIAYSIISFYSNAAWILPLAFYSIICSQLSVLATSLETLIRSEREKSTLTFKFIREKHKQLCGIVEMADKVLCYIALSVYVGYIPLLCLLFNQLAKLIGASDMEVILLITYSFWSLVGFGILSLFSYIASDVSTKIHGFYDLIQQSEITAKDQEEAGELVLLLSYLKSDPVGLTVGGMVVITKSMFLTVMSIIVSYFTVLVQLK